LNVAHSKKIFPNFVEILTIQAVLLQNARKKTEKIFFPFLISFLIKSYPNYNKKIKNERPLSTHDNTSKVITLR